MVWTLLVLTGHLAAVLVLPTEYTGYAGYLQVHLLDTTLYSVL